MIIDQHGIHMDGILFMFIVTDGIKFGETIFT